jgi:S1-C subfamily serine protease
MKFWIGVVVLALSAFGFYSEQQFNEDWMRSKVVKISSDHGMCSGEYVVAGSGETYILTAAHCKDLETDGSYRVTGENGAVHYVKRVAEDGESDLMLLEAPAGVVGLKIADRAERAETVQTFTHGSNLDTYKTSGVIIQTKVAPVPMFDAITDDQKSACLSKAKYELIDGNCILTTELTFSTAFVAGGSSGGPAVNAKGELVGVVSAGGQGYGLFVRLYDIRQFLDKY